MGETIVSIKDRLMESLNPSAFSLNSIPGIICVILIITLIYGLYKKATKAVSWFLSILLVYEAFYCLSLTGFNDLVPLSKVFKYDVLTAIAQLFVGTPICTGLLYVVAFISALMSKIWDLCAGLVHGMWWFVEWCIDLVKMAWQEFWTA